MQTEDSKTKPLPAKRKQKLSPELAEFLHMLNALEVELDTRSAPAR